MDPMALAMLPRKTLRLPRRMRARRHLRVSVFLGRTTGVCRGRHGEHMQVYRQGGCHTVSAPGKGKSWIPCASRQPSGVVWRPQRGGQRAVWTARQAVSGGVPGRRRTACRRSRAWPSPWGSRRGARGSLAAGVRSGGGARRRGQRLSSAWACFRACSGRVQARCVPVHPVSRVLGS